MPARNRPPGRGPVAEAPPAGRAPAGAAGRAAVLLAGLALLGLSLVLPELVRAPAWTGPRAGAGTPAAGGLRPALSLPARTAAAAVPVVALDRGHYTRFDVPRAANGTAVTDIDGAGTVVGLYRAPDAAEPGDPGRSAAGPLSRRVCEALPATPSGPGR